MKKIKFFTICFLLTASIQLFAQSDLGWDPKVTKGKLANGLTYYVRENNKPENKVELRLVVKVGSIMEDDDQQGLAHMAEHMAFNGTKNFKKNDIVSYLQDIGVGFGSDLNAYTGFDETVYILPIPTDKKGNLEKGFQILEDWAHNVTYLDEDINNERAIILEEARTRKGSNDRMFRKIYPELFKGSKYANRIPIGIDSIIKNFPPETIRRFYRDWYRPDLMAVVVVGDIKQADAMALIQKHFSGLQNPASPKPRTYAAVPPYSSSNAMVVTDKEATGYSFALNYPAYKISPSVNLEDYRKDLVQSLYESMMNARFRELTQKENPPFVYAYAGFGSYAYGHESFNVQASSGTNDIRRSIDAVSEEIERVKRYGFTDAELDRAKKDMTASYERSWNNRDKTESDVYADEYIRNFTEDEPVPGIDKEFEMVKRLLPGISLNEVNKLTDRYKDEKNRFAYVTGPENTATMKAPMDAEILAAIDAKSKTDIKPYEEKAVAADLLTKEPKSGKVIATTKNASLGTTDLKLSNGITVTLKRTDFKADQILMTSQRFGGSAGYSLADKYSAENAVSVVSSMGAGAFSPNDMRKALSGKTASVTPYISSTSEGFRGNSGNKDIETMLQMLYLYVTEPRNDSALFKSYIQRSKSQFAMMGANPQVAFIDTLNKLLYGGNPLAPTAIPKAENYDKINMNRAMAIYKERLGDVTGMHFYFVGSFNESLLIPMIEKYIGSLPASGKKTTYTDNKVRPFKGDKALNYKKGKEEKSLIIAVYNGEVPYTADLNLKMQALSEILNIKIIEEMREKIQGIYGGGTFANMSKVPYNGYQFALQLPCGPDKVDTLISEFRKELSSIAAKGPENSYLDKVKKQWIEEYKTNIKTNDYWLSKLQQFSQGESTPDRMLNFEKYAAALKPADVQSAARIILASPSKLLAVLKPE
ncbi:MAG TPA: insulinase family protein [Chitinophagaceae bacterium]|nr:insulinase family protein [Chitinophagaceae bacterium]